MASGFILYYSIWSLFATHLQADLKLSRMVATPAVLVANIVGFLGMRSWGWTADIGRRWAMIIPAAIAIPSRRSICSPPIRPGSSVGFGLQGAFGGASTARTRLSDGALPDRGAGDGERLLLSPGRDLRRLGGAGAGLFAATYDLGYAIPMLVGTMVGRV